MITYLKTEARSHGPALTQPARRYDEVKADVGGDAETLWSQASETYHRAQRKRRGKEVGVDEVRCGGVAKSVAEGFSGVQGAFAQRHNPAKRSTHYPNTQKKKHIPERLQTRA